MNKPFIRHGRFYNDATESIITRLVDVVRVAGKVSVQKLSGGRTTHKLGMSQADIAPWLVSDPVLITTLKPVVTWLGHATFLIQVAGLTIITDPIFFDISRVMKRVIPFPIKLSDLPPIDVVLLSHNHRDHLDEPSMVYLKRFQPIVYAPFGDEAWFITRGFKHVHGNEWWQQHSVKDVTFTFLPASHWSGRGLSDVNRSLWGSWMLTVGGFTLYFAGDTAYSDHFKAIGQRFLSIDLALLPIGPEEPRNLMKQSHTGASEAVQAFIDLNAHQFIPMHWGTFPFGMDSLSLPIDRLKEAWYANENKVAGRSLILPRCGQPLEFAFEREQ